MNKTATRTLGALVLSLVLSTTLTGQMIWPGDINNNGIVNGIDLLYWGVSNRATGPVRPAGSTTWQEQPMGNPWVAQFPASSHNYAYGDVNGDGQINNTDADALMANFRRNHGTLVPDTYTGSLAGSDPRMNFSETGGTVVSGQSKEVFFNLGSEDASFAAVYGVTFTINYPPNTLRAQNGVQFALLQESWFNPTNADAAVFIDNNAATGKAVVTMVRTNQANTQGGGKMGRFIFNFSDLTAPNTPQELAFTITNVAAIDKDMNPVGVQSANFSFYTLTTGGGCANTVNPVCGSNGVTYLNACYAEAAGIFSYTPGTCFSTDCINPAQINPNAVCPAVYDPVCGCNGITYTNQCAATAAGVVSTTPGPCATNSNCYDPAYVVISTATTVNATTGVITNTCPSTYAPVCGCNGVTYRNACVAEAAGITFYTQGTCESACIDPSAMNPAAVCTTAYNPVCGCNGVTYTNACEATAAGVTSYTQGTCGGSSNWCSTATPIQCGDFLPYETTVGAGNKISQYPSCLNTTMLGADKVYVIQKQTAGDLQIGLEIITPGLDLDLFLLAANCNQVTCLAKSTTNNTITNNEGIIYPNAPIGTYYIVVDGQYANSAGAYRLEVSCGYLYCGNAVPLTCGQPYTGTNANGRDDVSLYTCGNVLNVENNGPEIVHTFTTTQDGPVSISLTGLSANLELFLLRACDRGQCMHYSENAGTSNEQINAYLTAGTYYVVVDGYNGAVSNYTLTVNCTSACNFTLANLSATSSGCGSNSGSINIASAGGTPNYLVTYSGPLSGSFTTSSNSCTIYYLPPGTYTVTKTDANGCTISGTVTILGGGGLTATLTPNHAVCMTNGYVRVVVANGQAPYHIYVTGPVSGSATSNVSTFNINNLTAGNYSIRITDNQGCTITQQVTINQSSGNFIWNNTVTPASCGGYGAIHVNTYNGYAPYNIIVSGPVSGSATVYSNSFNIINLPAGTYQVTVEDDNWCTYVRTVVVPGGNLSVQAQASSGVCGTNGSVNVSMANGTPNYNITWTGPVNGSTTTSSANYVIPNLPAGSYAIAVTDAQGCSDYRTVTVSAAEGGGLSLNVIPLPGSCTQNGALWIDIFNGNPLYTISWTGPSNGIIAINDDGLDIPNLPCGTYTVTVTDMNGCSGSQTVTLGGCDNIDINLTPQNGICGSPGALVVNINGGTPTYNVSWTGPVTGQTTANTNILNLPNLPAGTYSVYVTDANGCTDYAVAQVTTAASNLTLSASVTNAVCGGSGSITVQVSGGTPLYQISWSGPQSGSVNSSSATTTLPNLTAGTYTIYVVDGNGCSATITRTVQNTGSNLQLSLVGNNGVCSQFGNIGVYVSNGVAPYQISWTGPTSGSAVSNNAIYQIQNALAGTYSVFVTDGNGCSTSGTVQISIQNNLNANLQPNPGVCGSNGSIGVNITQGSAPYTINWSGPVAGSAVTPNNQYTIGGLPSGTYTVVITDANGCSRTLTTTLNNTNGGLTIVTALIYNVCGQYNTIWVDVVGGTPPYTVTWQGGQTGSGTTTTQGYEIEDLPPGTYKVIVVDANGCMDMEQDIIIYPAPVNLFTATPTNGICGAPGSIQLNIFAGTGPYTVSWNGPVSGTQIYNTGGTYVLNNLPGGTYTFTLTDVNGCTETETVILNTGTPVDLITALIYNECGQYNTIWVDIVGGTPPYTITWQGGQTGSGTTTTLGFEIYDLPPGTYKVIVVDANGCMDMEQDIIIYPAPINIFTATSINGICSGPGSIVVNVLAGTAPYSLTWTGPSNGSTLFSGSTYTIPNLPAGTYTLAMTDANGCTENEVVVVSTGESGVVLVATTTAETCITTASITAQASGGSGTYQLVWTGPESGSATIGTAPFVINNIPTGNYTLTVNDTQGCDDSANVTVSAAENDLSATATPTPGTCSGLGQIGVNISGGTPAYTVSWAGPSSGSSTINGTFLIIPNLQPGNYTISVLSGDGCTVSANVQLAAPTGNITLNATPVGGVCGGAGYINLNIGGGTAPYQISWTGAASGTLTTNSSSVQLPNLGAGSYTITVNSGICTASITRTVPASSPNITLATTVTNAICGVGGAIQVQMGNAVGTTVLTWSGPQSGSQTLGGNTFNIANLPNGTYTINANNNGCTATTQVVVGSNNGNLNVGVNPTHAVCGQLGSLSVVFSGGAAPYTVVWSGPVSGSTTVNGNSYQILNLPAGNYIVTVNSGNCTGSATTSITNSNGNLSLTATPQHGTCQMQPGFLISFGGGTAPYQLVWQGPVSGNTSVNGNSYTLTNVPAGYYTFTLTDAAGCSIWRTATVNDNSMAITLTPQAGICGDNAAIQVAISNGTGPYQITWSGEVNGFATSNAPNYTIQPLPGSTYLVTVQDANGCLATGTVTVVSGPSDFQVIHTVSNNGCGELNNIWMDFYNGVGPYTVQWIGPVSGTITTPAPYYDIVGAPTGSYIIIVTDANGCVDVQQVDVVNIVNTMNVVFTPNDGSCGGLASIDLAITGGTPWYTIAWYRDNQPLGEVDINAGFYTIHSLSAGTYLVRVTDDNGCERTATVTVSTPANVLQLTTSIVGPGCFTSGSVGLLLDGGQAPYAISWTGQQQGNAVANTDSYLMGSLSGGTYNIQIQDANGCGNTFSVVVPGSTVGNLQAGYSYTVDGTEVTFQNQSGSGQYQWNFGDGIYSYETHPSHTYNAPGTYNVCLTVSGSCGSNVECQSITISASANLALLDIGERQGGNSTVVSLPVTIQNATNLISLAGSVRVVNGAVGYITGTTPGSISPQYNASNNTFSYFNNNGIGVNVNPAQPLFYLNMMLTGTPGQSTVVEFAQTPLPIELGIMQGGIPTSIPYTLSAGTATVMNVAGLHGQVATYWGDGIEEAEVSINGPGYASAMMTDETGSYDMPDLTAGMEYTVTANKNIGHSNGLSTYALFIGQRFLLGMNPPQITSPYQIIAGDANCNDAFTTLDLFLIQRLIIGAAEEFAHCPSWVFVADDNPMPTVFDAYNVFPYASASTTMLMADETANFVGVKVGDILGQANPHNFGGGGDDRSLTTLPFTTPNRAASAGEVVTLYFTSDAFHDMVSYQFGLQFATHAVEFVEFLPAEASPFHTVIAGDNHAADGRLRLSWFSLDGNGHSADGETPLFALRFRVLADISDWSSILRLDAGSMLPEAYNSANEGFDPTIDFSGAVTSTDDAAQVVPFALYQNTPNPLRDATVISFYLPEAAATELVINDPFGRVVWQQAQHYPAGMQRVRLDDVQLPAGIYYYTLRAGTHHATRSMVVVK